MEPASQKINVFISYSQKDDDKYLKELQIHLKPLEQRGQIVLWSDDKITAGTDWQKAIKQAIQKARVAILLISPDFMASDFISKNELPPLLQEEEDKKRLEVIPVILRPYYTKNTNLARFQALNSPSTPVIGMSKAKRDRLWVKVAEAVDQAVERQLSSRSTSDDAQPEQDQQQPLSSPDLILPPEDKTQQSPNPARSDIQPPQKKTKTSQQPRRGTRTKGFCPYCHSEINLAECHIVATQPLHARGTLLSRESSLDRASLENMFRLHREKQPRHQCKQCQYILPPDIATTDIKKIVIAGNAESGLPSYIAALIYQMSKQSILSDTKQSPLHCVTPLVKERYNQEISGEQFVSLQELVHGPNHEAEDLACPLIYELPARTTRHQRVPKTYLALYEVTDNSFTSNARIRQHVSQADACIYLHSSKTSSRSSSSAPILQTLFPELSVAPPFARLPVAVTFTKADLLNSPDDPLPYPPTSSTGSGVNLEDLRNVEQTLLKVLANYADAQRLITTARSIDSKLVHLFAVSSLHGTSLSREPFRCLDPLLWLLHKLGLIASVEDTQNNSSEASNV